MSFIRIIYFFTALLLCSLPVLARQQPLSEPDSLEELLPLMPTDTSKVGVLLKLSKLYLRNNSSVANQYANSAYELSGKLEYHLAYLEACMIIGEIKVQQGDFVEAQTWFNKALEMAITLKNDYWEALVYNKMGNTFFRQGSFDVSLEYMFKALYISESKKDDFLLAETYNNIGSVYASQKNYQKALDFYEKSKAVNEEMGNQNELARNYNNSGIVNNNLGMSELAMKYYKMALEINTTINNKFSMAKNLNNIGSLYEGEKKWDEALGYFMQSAHINQDLGSKASLSNNFNNIGEVLLLMGRNDEAYDYLSNALDLAKQTGAKDTEIDSYAFLSKYYESIHDFEKANTQWKRYIAEKDSLYNTDKSIQISRLQTLYETNRKEKENDVLRKDKALQDKELEIHQLVNYGAFGISSLLVVILVLVFRSQRRSKRINSILKAQNNEINQQKEEILSLNNNLESLVKERTLKLERQNKLLTEYAFMNAHKLRAPLATILGLVSLTNKGISLDDKLAVIEKLGVTARELDRVVREMQSILDDDMDISDTNPVD